MKLYVWYAKEEPHLPIAVTDSIPEMVKITGMTREVIMSSISHGRETFARVEIEDEKIEGKKENDIT